MKKLCPGLIFFPLLWAHSISDSLPYLFPIIFNLPFGYYSIAFNVHIGADKEVGENSLSLVFVVPHARASSS